MAYSNVMLKGRIGYNNYGWPLIVMERAKSDNPLTAVLCEVFGLYHECGSVYYRDISLTDNQDEWNAKVREMGHDPFTYYFQGKLVI